MQVGIDSIGTAKVIYRICVLRVKSSICYTKKTMLMSLMHQLSVPDECMTLTVDAGSISFIKFLVFYFVLFSMRIGWFTDVPPLYLLYIIVSVQFLVGLWISLCICNDMCLDMSRLVLSWG
jgi:hypothetical protein